MHFSARDGLLALPSKQRAPNALVHIMGVAGLVIFVFFFASMPDVADVGEGLMVLAFLLSWRRVGAVLGRDALFWLFLLWSAWLLVSSWLSPIPLAELLDDVRRNSRLFAFLLIAWWLGGRPKAVFQVLALALVGFLLAIVLNADWQNPQRLLGSRRLDFGIVNALHFGLFAGAALLGVLCFRKDIQGGGLEPGGHRLLRYARYIAWLVLMLVCVQALLVSQARAVWVAMILVFLFWLLLMLSGLLGPRARWKPRRWVHALVVIALVGGIVISQWDMIDRRFAQEAETVRLALSGNVDEVPLTSFGLRVHLSHWGMEKSLERPMLGWGARSTRTLLEQSELPSRVKNVTGRHTHNTFLELLLTTGVIGLTILAVATWIFVRRLWPVRRRDPTQARLVVFLLCTFLLFVLASTSNVYIYSRTGMYYLSLFGGIGYALYLFQGGRDGSGCGSTATDSGGPAGAGPE